MNSKKIVLIGDVILDIIPTVFPINKENILIDGETFVEGVTFQRGGCGGNFACVLKSIYKDAQVKFISRIGNDQNGDFLIKEMERYGVEHHFSRDTTVSTQITIAVSYNDGERHFITNLGGLDSFSLEHIPQEIFSDFHHLAYRGPWFSERLLFKCGNFIKMAKEKGLSVSLDLGFDPFWNKKNDAQNHLLERINKRKESILKALSSVDYLFGNEQEFTQITNSNSLDEALSILLERGVNTIILHRGAKGAAIITKAPNNEQNNVGDFIFVEIPAAKVEVKNPVGSGDTFDSIFISQILENKTPKEAAIYASAGAAYSLQSEPGTKVTMEKIEKFFHQQPNLKNFFQTNPLSLGRE